MLFLYPCIYAKLLYKKKKKKKKKKSISKKFPIGLKLGIHTVQTTSLRERPRLPSYFPSILSTFPIHVSWEPDQSYHVKMAPVVSLSW